ncbi:uracil-xanthine permease family protein [Spirulina sp. CS-785/01]|uniref:uracil-xanthine permease family protein n=1 Tax=Spirulina sp. CS-785/01 TaxID=3021716 RepID=UPI00232EA0CD|nr:uracil-xanthine permease family protein [Spirulina sp. CS-785/01]MDB9315152.1 uracil-xanthine permease family protein [Spirulina sp. CS-785/01]
MHDSDTDYQNPTDSTRYQLRWQDIPLGIQMLFVAFGALVLVPILVGFDPNVALFTAGVGTLLFQLITGGKVPVFLASSFAFIAPIQFGVKQYGVAETLSGLMAAGGLYLLLSLIIFWRGPEFVLRILPPIVTGPVIMVIGLSLAPVAIDMVSQGGDHYTQGQALVVGGISLLATMLTALFSRGWLQLVPILVGIGVGYGVSLLMGMVVFDSVLEAPWLAFPSFTTPKFHFPAILFILPVAIAPAIEHFGDILAISSVAEKNYLHDPGVHRTLLGDGLATTVAAFLGGPPNTTYSEVTGAVALTKIFNPAIMSIAAIAAIILAFVGKLGAFLRTIPPPVMGGILIILFGTIVIVGMNSLVRSGENLLKQRNVVIVGIILIFGVGGLTLETGAFALEGIGLCSVAGVLLNWLLPQR